MEIKYKMIDAFFGQKIVIHFKNFKQNLAGVLFDRDDDFLYLQADQLLIIPNNNVLYLSMFNEIEQQPLQQKQNLKIFVNSELVANLDVPAEINLLNANQDLLNFVWGNQIVQKALDGHVQKNLEYAPGEVYITTNMANLRREKENDSFDISSSAGSITTNFIQPIEMVQRLQGLGQKTKRNNE